jgi:hypothetical protein
LQHISLIAMPRTSQSLATSRTVFHSKHFLSETCF